MVKRLFDMAFVVLMAWLWLPILALTALVVALVDGRPIFFLQQSLDEVPQLVNVLKGDMSLVGPRPLPTIYLPRYSPEQARRHEVRPGITGWAQVHGRNALTWEDKFRYDVEYVVRHSLWMDLKILLLTIPAAFAGGDDATEFKGSNVL